MMSPRRDRRENPTTYFRNRSIAGSLHIERLERHIRVLGSGLIDKFGQGSITRGRRRTNDHKHREHAFGVKQDVDLRAGPSRRAAGPARTSGSQRTIGAVEAKLASGGGGAGTQT